MRKTSLIAAVSAAALVLTTGRDALAQIYSNTVIGMNPVGYWPLNESTPPPQPLSLTALNYGSLGASGNGYYGAWYQPSGATWFLTNNMVQAPAVTFPYDGSKGMLCQGAPGQYVVVPRNTNGVANTALALNPPFSIEAWLKIGTTASALGDIISQGGTVNLNIGGPDTNNPYYGGHGTGWAGVELGQYQDYIFLMTQSTNGTSKSSELDTSGYNQHKGFQVGEWVHVVATFDGTTEAIWTNGALCVSKTSPANAAGQRFVVDPTTPLMIGGGSAVSASYGQGYQGTIHDVAIYNTVLPQSSIQNHFETAYGTNATYGSVYTNAVLADSPVLYYRLNDPVAQTNAGYPSTSFPVANNYGSSGAAGNGVYQPGTTPGVAGPAFAGFGGSSKAAAFNGWFGAVDIGGGNLPANLNPTGTVPLTVVSWFQTGPADAPGRFQEFIGHGDKSYRMAIGQVAGENHFNPGPGPELQFTSPADVITNGFFALNDGNWHMAAGVSDGTNEYLYLDGVLAKTASNTTNGINILGNTNDLLIGGDSQYTYASFGAANTIRTFDGQVAQVAFWTNALTAVQIQSLFSAAGVPPYVAVQPLGTTNNAGTNISSSATVRGSATLSFQWYHDTGTPATGQTNSTLLFPAATSNADESGNYYLVASNPYGAVTSSIVSILIFGPPTVLSQTPTDLRIFAGASPTLQVTASGAQPIHYQWSSNGVPIINATNSSYTVPGAQASATYTCQMNNFVSTSPITPISMTVLADPAAPYPTKVLADHPVNYFRLDEADTGYPNDGVVAYDYAGGLNGSYSNTALAQAGYSATTDPSETSAGFGTASSMDSYMGNVPPYLNFATPSGSNAEFSVEAWVNASFTPNTDAGIVAIGYGFGGEQFALDCGGNDSIPASAHSVRFYVNSAAGRNYGVSSTFVLANYPGWHHVVAVCDEAGGHIYLYIDGNLQGSTAIPAGAGLQGETAPLAIGSRLSTTSATDYDNQFYGNIDDVALYNYPLSQAQIQNHYFQSGVAPMITGLQPSSNWTTNQSADVMFTVTATGTAPLAYQWTDNNGNPIPWGTGPTLVLTNVQPSQAGNYTVYVTNLYSGASSFSGGVSTNVNLTVTQVPQIVSDITPSNVTVYAGSPITLTVVVSGTPPLHYQWYQDAAPILNATNSSYALAVLSGTHSYYLSVTNIYSAGNPTVSSTATVTGMPATTLNPTNYTDHLKITFAGYNRGETLSDFPALVRLSTNLPGFNYSHFASPSGGDLRFTDSGGSRLIPSDINLWNPNGESTVWVQIPALSGTNDAIYAYWGNASAATPLPGTNVWVPQPWEGLPAFDVVYHLEESGFPYADAAGQFPALSGAAPTPVAGLVGIGQSFSSSFLDAGTINVGNQFTVSAWVNMAPSASNIQGIWASKAGGNSSGFGLFVNSYQTSDGKLILETGNGNGPVPTMSTATGTVGAGQWHFVTAAIDREAPTAHLFVDGTPVAASGSVQFDFGTNNDVNLGHLVGGAFPINGLMDEARIQSGTNSANWVWASWMTVAQTTNLESYSMITSTVTNAPMAVTINVKFTAGNVTMSGAGGSAGATYYVIGSTNLALPLSQWTVLSTNTFDGSGNFNVSLPVDTTKRTQFLRIKE